MATILHIHPTHPQARLIAKACQLIDEGAVCIYPTDSCYAIGCHLNDRKALARISQLRGLKKHHNFTLLCQDLGALATYARVDNPSFRWLKAHTPGPYTFILTATRELPKQTQNPKRKTIGLRIPSNPITRALLQHSATPLLSCTLVLPGVMDGEPLHAIDDIIQHCAQSVDVIIDGGDSYAQPTTVIDLSQDVPQLLRQGGGDASPFV